MLLKSTGPEKDKKDKLMPFYNISILNGCSTRQLLLVNEEPGL